jgi:hypothetical protein
VDAFCKIIFRRRIGLMKHTRRPVAGLYIFISVFSLLFLGGCIHWFWDKGDHRCADRPAGAINSENPEKNCDEHRGANPGEYH